MHFSCLSSSFAESYRQSPATSTISIRLPRYRPLLRVVAVRSIRISLHFTRLRNDSVLVRSGTVCRCSCRLFPACFGENDQFHLSRWLVTIVWMSPAVADAVNVSLFARRHLFDEPILLEWRNHFLAQTTRASPLWHQRTGVFYHVPANPSSIPRPKETHPVVRDAQYKWNWFISSEFIH